MFTRSHDLGGASFDRDYAYDGMDRLASDGDVAYSHDAAGNRTSRAEDGETVAYALGTGDRLASWTGGSYAYDAAGCVTRITRGADTWDLAWNGQYQLVSVSTNGAFAEAYSYDALGRRVTTRNAEGTERHVYDDSWQVIADLDEGGNVIRSYVWDEGIDRLLAVKIGSRTYTALTDVQGTVWGCADEQGNVVARWTYDAWGNVLSGVAELRAVRYRFQGRERSAATGLTNFRMRWYDTVTGRWLSKDPIGLSGGLNLYAFCGNDGMNEIDPLGLKIWYSDAGGGHSTVWVQDPFGCGYWMIDFGPANGGKNNLTLNVLFGPSKLTLTPVSHLPNESDMICIDTSAEDDFWALISASRLQNADLPYDLIGNNCAHVSRAVMNAAGLGLGSPLFDSPSRLKGDLLK